MKDSTRSTAAFLVTGFLASIIAYLTLFAALPEMGTVHNLDKVCHFIAFAALVFPVAFVSPRDLKWLLPLVLEANRNPG